MTESIISLDTPGDALPGSGGHGTQDILDVIKGFEGEGIPCCVVGIGALKYFGARRRRDVSMGLE